MKLLFRTCTAGFIGLAFAAGTLAAIPISATAHASEPTRPSALPAGITGAVLTGVTTLSSKNVWAVGYSFAAKHRVRPLIQHWDGTRWSRQASPNRTGGGATVLAASALNPKDAWAVGTTYGRHTRDTLIDHWDGKRWTRVPSPSPGGQASLFAVDAQTRTDAWAVGFTGPHSLIEHWDGKAWKIVRAPEPGRGALALESVSGVSAHDAWAVGSTFSNAGVSTFTEHWDGKSWTRVASPNPGVRRQNELWGVTAVSAHDVWAVGDDAGSRGTRTLAMRWDGTRWSVSSTPPKPAPFSTFAGVSSTSAQDVWAVGYTRRSTLVAHWDGHGWSRVASPNPGHFGSNLLAVGASEADDAWAVGVGYPLGHRVNPLTEHWDGSHWTVP